MYMNNTSCFLLHYHAPKKQQSMVGELSALPIHYMKCTCTSHCQIQSIGGQWIVDVLTAATTQENPNLQDILLKVDNQVDTMGYGQKISSTNQILVVVLSILALIFIITIQALNLMPKDMSFDQNAIKWRQNLMTLWHWQMSLKNLWRKHTHISVRISDMEFFIIVITDSLTLRNKSREVLSFFIHTNQP